MKKYLQLKFLHEGEAESGSAPSLQWLITIALALLLAYLPKLLQYELSGDDLYLMAAAPRGFSDFCLQFFSFAGSYRPLGHSLFVIYRALLPHTFIILLLNFALMTAVAGLLFLNLSRLMRKPMAALLAVATMLSPIFYYHFFAIAALNNTLVLLFLLTSLLLVNFGPEPAKQWKVAVGAVLLVLAILSKESFLVNALVFFIIAWQNLTKKQFAKVSLLTVGVLGVYFGCHFYFYESSGDYALGNSLTNGLSMFVDLLSWLLAYPRGWQYAAPEPKTISTYLITIVTLLSWTTIFYHFPVKKWRTQLLFPLALILSIAPFFIIDKVLVFYLDVALIVLVLWVSYNQHLTHNYLASILLAVSLIWQFVHYYPQWQKYSFVANANEVVHNFTRTLVDQRYKEYPQLCVINNVRGSFGSADGQAASLLLGYQGGIIATPEDVIPDDCSSEALILRNNGWQFEVINATSEAQRQAD